MNQAPPRDITPEEISAYEKDGVALLKGLVDEDWIERLRAAIDVNMADPGPYVLEYAKDGPGRYHGDMFVWQRNPDFRAFVFDSPAAPVAAALMGARKVNFFYDHLLVMEPGTGVPTPWHHDQPYWCVQGHQVMSLWLALDEVTAENGALEYVKGSHKWGKWYRPQSFTGDDRYSDDDMETLPDINAARGDYDIVSFDMKPGDMLAHHALTVHGSPGNAAATKRRRGLATRWTGDDAIYDPRPKIFKFPDPKIPAGGPMDSDQFPVVWRQG